MKLNLSRSAGIALIAGMIVFITACSSSSPSEDTVTTITIDTAFTLTNRPYGVAISSGGIVYVTRLDNASMARYNLGSRTLVKDSVAVGGTPTGVAITPSGAEAYVASQDGNLDVVKLSNDSALVTRVIAGSGFNAGVTPDGNKAYISTNINRVYVFSTATRAIIDSMPAGPSPNWFTFTPAGDKVLYSDPVDGFVRRAVISTGASAPFVAAGGGAQGIAFSANGSRLYIARQYAGDILVVHGTTGVRLDSIPLPASEPFGLVRQPNSDLLWVTTLSGHLILVNTSHNEVVADSTAGGTLRRIAFNADGTTAVIADQDGRVLFVH